MNAHHLTLTYIGGPTALLEFGPYRLLTDPTFDPAGGTYPTGRTSLHKLSAPALPADALGPIDGVLLSHDHHSDNLDHAGRSFLPRATRVLTTVDGATRLGGNAKGLQPWQTIELPGVNGQPLTVVAAPARHGPADNDRGPCIGFVCFFPDAPNDAIYFAGDTVWYDGVAEVARRYPVRAAILNLGAARIPQVGPFALTMTADDGVEAARAFADAAIVPLHFEGWAHFSEGRDEIARAFAAAGLAERLHWPDPGRPIQIL